MKKSAIYIYTMAIATAALITISIAYCTASKVLVVPQFDKGIIQYTAELQDCNYIVEGSNLTLHLNATNCTSINIVFNSNSQNNKILCGEHYTKNVVFSNNTFNNSIINCAFENASLTSMYNASNNIINCTGQYNVSFADNKSNLAIGYYFTFISKNLEGMPSVANYITIAPFGLESLDNLTMKSQHLTSNVVEEYANSYSYKMPRFGVYILQNSSGKLTLPLEKEELYKNKAIEFSPYWLICPYWGWDILTFKKFELNSSYTFSPSFLYPTMHENVLLPANKPVYWNFTIRKYSNAPDMQISIFNGWQYKQDAQIVFEKYNVSNGTISYDAGLQKPGIYQYIGVLYSPKTYEKDNSTTETYGVGLAFCMPGGVIINQSGYYPMSSNSLTKLNTFWANGSYCDIGSIIQANNVTINCNKGSVYGTNNSFIIENSENTRIENCTIYGNAITAINSTLEIINSRIIAKNSSNIAINSQNSKVILNSTKEYGYTITQ
ncbi:MAG: hypothetical protein QW139_00120 [Candidatus Micrarchaeaceae archaeon]